MTRRTPFYTSQKPVVCNGCAARMVGTVIAIDACHMQEAIRDAS